MSILTKLYKVYRAKGLRPVTGYNSHHFFGWQDAPFTVFREGLKISGCAGLALQEIMFLEHLGKYLSPANCLIIGNAMGWSTLATALTFPKAKTVGMDNSDVVGIELTNEAFETLGLSGGALLAESPNDIDRIVSKNLNGPIDFVLIDALHNNEAIQTDFHAVRRHASPDCVYLFHDVINWSMLDGFKQLLDDSGLNGRVLTRTASGMAIAFSSNLSTECLDYIDVFCDDTNFFKHYRHAVRRKVDHLALFEQELPPLSR
jgi:hypothetical protein